MRKVKDIFTIVGVWAWQFSSFCELEFAATGKWSSLHYPINYLLKATYATTLHTYYDYKITYLVKIWPVDIEKKLDLVMTAFLSFNLKINVFQKLTKNFEDCSTHSELKISDLKFFLQKG